MSGELSNDQVGGTCQSFLWWSDAKAGKGDGRVLETTSNQNDQKLIYHMLKLMQALQQNILNFPKDSKTVRM